MFEDTKKELQNLEQELQNLEKKDDAFEDFYAQILEEFGEKPHNDEAYLKDLLYEKPQSSRPVNHNTNAYADQHKKAAPVKKDHSIRNLTIVIVIELLGIAGIAAWWILQLL